MNAHDHSVYYRNEEHRKALKVFLASSNVSICEHGGLWSSYLLENITRSDDILKLVEFSNVHYIPNLSNGLVNR